jgi:hypothetical protein
LGRDQPISYLPQPNGENFGEDLEAAVAETNGRRAINRVSSLPDK